MSRLSQIINLVQRLVGHTSGKKRRYPDGKRPFLKMINIGNLREGCNGRI